MQTIYSVEDDGDIRDLLRFSLQGLGYAVSLFCGAEEMFKSLSEGGNPDLILLDIMLPGMDGAEALKRLKAAAATKNIPVIMLTAKSAEINIVNGLNAGADDYVTKPFSVMELSARINAQLRKSDRPKKIGADGIVMDAAAREAFLDGKPLPLTLKEFELLYALLKTPNSVCRREDLLSGIWGYEYLGETRTLDMHIRSLRGKLGAHADGIVTVRGVGFKYSRKADAKNET
ncbi:MAG: response regulator transcription factor [Clostridiales bacterium]|jgi:two-component system alkaline phosphatase synthesis response regulator PhoP|nr:response regulator transcription factor [Clostridiales bacterium]